jgi:hypothetical protein
MNNPIEDYKKLWEWLKNPNEENYDKIPEPLRTLSTFLIVMCGFVILGFFLGLITGELRL